MRVKLLYLFIHCIVLSKLYASLIFLNKLSPQLIKLIGDYLIRDGVMADRNIIHILVEPNKINSNV